MNQFAKQSRSHAYNTRKLRGFDWILAGVVFLVSGSAAYSVLVFARLPMGLPAVIGLSVLGAFAAALACSYVWQFDFSRKVRMRSHAILLMIYIAIALCSAVIGVHSGNRRAVELLAHGKQADAGIGITLPWIWLLGGALGAFYVQVWTVVRYLLIERLSTKKAASR